MITLLPTSIISRHGCRRSKWSPPSKWCSADGGWCGGGGAVVLRQGGDPALGETFRSRSKFTRELNPTPSFSPEAKHWPFFGLWRVCFPPVLVRTGRRLPVQALGERRVLVAVTGYPRGGAPGPGRSFVTRATRNQREIWYMKSGPSRVNAPLRDL